MDIELQEIRDFLSQNMLFDDLPESSINMLVSHLVIRYLRRGQVFPPEDVTASQLYLLRRGAIELRDADENLVEKMGEGDVCTEPCLDRRSSFMHGHASEDSLVYLIPCTLIHTLRQESQAFDKHFTQSIQQRMKQALATSEHARDTQGVMQFQVRDLTDRHPVSIEAQTTIAEAAKIMTDEHVSSVLVVEQQQLVGMLTDRDLRRRCLAKDLSPTKPIREIMTSNLITIDDNTVLSDALLTMTKHQIHHLPVMQNNQPIGNLSVTDLIRHLGTNSAFIASDIEKAKSVEALVRISQRLPELQFQLAMANTSARHIGEVISTITDSLTRRLLQLGEEKLGPAPVNYVWLAGGSQGRSEQTSHSDQDNALFIDDSMNPDDDVYFKQLSQFVSDGLNACGYIYCPGNAMATNDKWRQPVQVWRRYFSNWIERPEKMALMLSSIFFDLRPVYGEAALFEEVQKEILQKSKANGIFIAYMVANALSHKPPLGFFRNFVLIHDQEHDNTLDIKHRGIVPIVDIGRIYALSEGLTVTNTSERLQAAHEVGAMSQEMSENLIDALEYIADLRIQHQAQQIRHGEQADNYLDPKTLSGLERGHLKDSFMIIKDMQEVLENRHQSERIG